MRTDVPQTLIDAFENPAGVNVRARLRSARARHFSTVFEVGHAAAFAQAPGIHDSPLPQDGKLIGGLFISLFNNAGDLWLATSFGDPIRPTQAGAPLACEPYCRPALAGLNDNIAEVFYISGTSVYRASIDVDLLKAGEAECVLDSVLVYDLGKPASLHAVSSTCLAALYVDDGGVRAACIRYVDSAWTLSLWPGRCMFPGQVFYESSDTDRAWLNFSAAAQLGEKVFIYLSHPDGQVMGCIYNTSGVWSDSFEAMPADLSRFALANAVVYQDRLYLCGQFKRVDQDNLFVSPFVYGLLLSSTDGKVFSLDRFTAFGGGDADDSGSAALRWLAGIAGVLDDRYGVEGVGVVYSDANRWMALPAHFGLDQVVGDYQVEGLASIQGDQSGIMTIRLPDLDDLGIDLREGDVLDVDLGAVTATGYVEWFQFMRCFVTNITATLTDGDRTTSIEVVPWTAGRLAEMTHPFALTLQGREMLHDDLDNLDNFDPATEEGFVLFPVSVDFWDSGNQVDPGTHSAGVETAFSSGDLKTALDLADYPEIQSLPFDIECYGWSRSGNPTPYEGGTGDQPSNLNAPNDKVKCKLTIRRSGENDDLEIVVSDVSPNWGGYDHFPQTWYKTEDGEYPVVLEADDEDGLQAGDQIVEIDLIFSNTRIPDTAETVFFAERVEIPSIMMRVHSFKESWEPVHTEVAIPTSWDFHIDNQGWVAEEADDTGDPTVSYGWNYAPGCRVDGTAKNYIQIDVSRPGDSYPPTADGCGHVGPNLFATGSGKFAWTPPAAIYATVNSSFTVEASVLFRHNYIISGGAARAVVLFTDGSAVQLDGIICPSEESVNEQTFTFNLPDNVAGKQVEKLSLVGTGRGYLIRFYTASIAGFEVPEIPPDDGQSLMRYGIPVIWFAQKPFYTINFSAAAKFRLAGDDAWGGVVGLASDGENYIAARASVDKIEIIKARAGLVTVLAEAAIDFPDLFGWVMLRHVDGNLEARTLDVLTGQWTNPLAEYAWTEADGPMLVDNEISHVGLYGLRDAPYVRICGLDLGMGCEAVGILPGSHRYDDLPASGTLRIEDCSYTYGAKHPAGIQMGPYQGRNVGGPFEYSSGGINYGGNAAEFTRFEWADNAAKYTYFSGEYMATDTGVVWEITATDYHPFITTEGVTVYLKNRGRFFSYAVNGDVIGMSIQVWITHALTGLVQIDGEATTHGKGVVAYLTNTSTVEVFEFEASSNDADNLTDQDAIDRISRIAAGSPAFPGDMVVDSLALSGSPQRLE